MIEWFKNWYRKRMEMVARNSGLLPDTIDFDSKAADQLDEDLAHELRQIEEYNKAHENDLPLGMNDPNFGIYPTEVSMIFEYPNYTYRATVVKIVDGDTIDVMLDLGLYTSVRKRLRFLDMDAWEVRGEERELGLKATERVTELLDSAEEVMVQTKMDSTGKYGRLLAVVWVRAADSDVFINVNTTLVLEGHATVYES